VALRIDSSLARTPSASADCGRVAWTARLAPPGQRGRLRGRGQARGPRFLVPTGRPSAARIPCAWSLLEVLSDLVPAPPRVVGYQLPAGVAGSLRPSHPPCGLPVRPIYPVRASPLRMPPLVRTARTALVAPLCAAPPLGCCAAGRCPRGRRWTGPCGVDRTGRRRATSQGTRGCRARGGPRLRRPRPTGERRRPGARIALVDSTTTRDLEAHRGPPRRSDGPRQPRASVRTRATWTTPPTSSRPSWPTLR